MNPINPNTTKVEQSFFPLSLKPSSPTSFPLAYSDNVWDIVRENTSMFSIAGQIGQYTQHDVNEMIGQYIAGIVESLGLGCIYMGIATPSTTPETGAKGFYFALTVGAYTNFLYASGSAITVDQGEIAAIVRSGNAWTKQHIMIRPYIDSVSKHWIVDGQDSGIVAEGVDGESAYEVWLDAGNQGTVQDFLNSLKATVGAFKPVDYDGNAPSAIGGTATAIGGVTASAATKNIIVLMPNAASDPTATRMYVTNETASQPVSVEPGEPASDATEPTLTYQFVYIGDLSVDLRFGSGQSLNNVHIVNDRTTGGVNDVLAAEQGKVLEQEISQLDQEVDVLSELLWLTHTRNWYNPNDQDAQTGYYLDSNGIPQTTSSGLITGYIPLTQRIGTLVSSINGIQQTIGGGYIFLYDGNKNAVAHGTIADWQGKAVWQSNVCWVRFSVAVTSGNYPLVQVEPGNVATDFVPFGKIVSNMLDIDSTISLTSKKLLENKTIALGLSEKLGISPTEKKSIVTWYRGQLYTSGPVSSYGFFYGEYSAKKGDTIVVHSPYGLVSDIPAVLRKNQDYTYTALLIKNATYTDYTYVVEEDATICMNIRPNTSTYDGVTGISIKTLTIYDILDSIDYVKKSEGKNLANPVEFIQNKYLSQTGALYDSDSYFITGYIPFTQEMGSLILSRSNGNLLFIGGGYIITYKSDKTINRSVSWADLGGGPLIWQENDAFVRFSVSRNIATNDQIQVEVGTYPTLYSPYNVYIPKSDLEKELLNPILFSSFRDSGEIGNGESLTLPITYVRDDSVLSALIEGTLESIDLGQGDGVYAGGKITVTDQNIIISNTSTPHGLTLTGRTVIIMSRGTEGKVTIIASNGGKFDIAFNSIMGGAPYIKNNGTNALDVELSFISKRLDSKIWLIGDSYLGVAETRWPYWVKQLGFTNYMIDNLPGGDSSEMITVFNNDLTKGCPRYAFWGVGMNDGTDVTSDNFMNWKKYILQFIVQCNYYNITPILATIPSVPNRNHESKNSWVRNSGFRYIDFAEAVNAQPDGTWDTGLLSSDNIHPSEEGAKVLASRVMIDFPEIAIY